jgi:hypothetical protein
MSEKYPPILNWPSEWEQENILKDITYLELRPIVLSVVFIGKSMA